ncbi:UBX domain-containing protein 4 [Dirofilaria immitis]|nr:UBX domain-containing protein 4 [Dirofilaria immitis]
MSDSIISGGEYGKRLGGYETNEGGIAEAIAKSREQNSLFIVNIQQPAENKDEQSVRMDQLWDSIDNNICQPALVGIRIFQGTETAKQFAQIYPVFVVPASYVIDLNGKPLDVITITEEINEDVFAQRIKIAMKTLNTACQSSSSTLTVTRKSDKEEAGRKESTTVVMDEKIKSYERKGRKSKEIERRTLGKLMLEAKASREERERREIMEQKNREKREQEIYLKNSVNKLRQISKHMKEERMNGLLANVIDQEQKAKSVVHQTDMPSSVSNNVGCRIQCKFPDGSTLVHQFASTDIFSQLIEVIKKDGRQGDDFYIVQMYPRKEFPDITQTFAELGLTPSATVLVLSKRKRIVATYSGSRWIRLFQYAIAAPFQVLYRILLYTVGYNGPTSPLTDATKSNTASSKVRKEKENSGHHQDRFRHEGNIRRFHNEEDSSHSDDEARWNGNSTQQL